MIMITKGLLKAEQREVGLLYNTVTDTVPEEEKIQATEFFGSSCIKVHQLYSRPPSFVSLRILQKKVEFFKLKYWEYQQPNDVIFSLSTYRHEVKVACIWNAHVTITKITTLKVASPSGYTQLSNTTVITLDTYK